MWCLYFGYFGLVITMMPLDRRSILFYHAQRVSFCLFCPEIDRPSAVRKAIGFRYRYYRYRLATSRKPSPAQSSSPPTPILLPERRPRRGGSEAHPHPPPGLHRRRSRVWHHFHRSGGNGLDHRDQLTQVGAFSQLFDAEFAAVKIDHDLV